MTEAVGRHVTAGPRSAPTANQCVVFLVEQGQPDRQLASVGSDALAVAASRITSTATSRP
jgi:hypothetical protein